MSKYYKAEDITELINACEWRMTLAKERNGEGFVDYSKQILDVDELTKRLSKLPTIEVSEDCISREWLISFIDAGHLRNPNEKCYSENDVVELIRNAPSVVVRNNRTTTEQSSMVGIVTCEECKRCEKGLVIERRADGQETIVNLCNRTKPPTMVSLDFYCKDGERIEE